MLTTILAKIWPFLLSGAVILGLVAALMVTRNTLAVRTQSLHNLTIAAKNYQDSVANATAKAKADDLEHARRVEAADLKNTTEIQNDLTEKLAVANRRATDYANRLRDAAKASVGGGGTKSLPEAGSATGSPDGASAGSELDDSIQPDARICARNTVLAQGWQDWWNKSQQVPDR